MPLSLLWTTLLLIACLTPASWLRGSEHAHVGLSHVDKIVHFGLFAGFGFFWSLVGSGRSAWFSLSVILVGVSFAILTELGQGLPMIGRDPDLYDAIADIIGLFVGSGLAHLGNRYLAGRLVGPHAEKVAV